MSAAQISARLLGFVVALRAAPLAAQPSVDRWPYHKGVLAADVGIVTGLPAALPTGLSRGIGAGIQRGRCLAWGVRASWATTSESSTTWQITHDEIRLRIFGAVQRDVGRASLGLRLGAGGMLVSESRLRQQGMRAGLSGDDLETSKLALLPTAGVDGVVALHVRGPWLLQLSAGPSVVVVDSTPRVIWSAEVGVAWQR